MSTSYSPDQFKYLIEDDPRQLRMHVKAYHPETERQVGSLSVQVREFPKGNRRENPAISQPQIRGAFVHPEHQRQGVGTELYDIAAHHLGSQPMHDTSVTPMAQSWAAKVGGALHPEMKTTEPFIATEVARGLGQRRGTYTQDAASPIHQQPKARQLAFRGM